MIRVAPANRLLFVVALLVPGLLCAQEHRGRKYKPPPPVANITVTVTKATNGKPVENAAVVFQPLKDGKDQGNMELKTNEEGKVTINLIPIGDVLRLQIIANGYQTFGNDYSITTDSKAIAVKLRRPAEQYSIYEKHPNGQLGGPKNEEPRVQPQSSQPPGTTE